MFVTHSGPHAAVFSLGFFLWLWRLRDASASAHHGLGVVQDGPCSPGCGGCVDSLEWASREGIGMGMGMGGCSDGRLGTRAPQNRTCLWPEFWEPQLLLVLCSLEPRPATHLTAAYGDVGTKKDNSPGCLCGVSMTSTVSLFAVISGLEAQLENGLSATPIQSPDLNGNHVSCSHSLFLTL